MQPALAAPDRLIAAADGTIWASAPGGVIRFRGADVDRVWTEPDSVVALSGGTEPGRVYAVSDDQLWQLADDRVDRIGALSTVPGCLAVDEVDRLALVARPGDRAIAAIPLPGGGSGFSLALPGPAAAICLSPDRRRIYAAIEGALLAIGRDGASEPIAELDGASLCGVTVTAAGLVAICATGVLYGINPRHRSTVSIWSDASWRPTAVAADKPGRRYLIATPAGPIAIAADGSRAEPLVLRYPSAT